MAQNASQDLAIRDIEAAFDESWFAVVYQPQMSLTSDQKLVGAEAFVRLDHPQYGARSIFVSCQSNGKNARSYQDRIS